MIAPLMRTFILTITICLGGLSGCTRTNENYCDEATACEPGFGCGPDHECQAGYCNSRSDCASGEGCTPSHTCQAGYCDSTAECEAGFGCSPSHQCDLGYCTAGTELDVCAPGTWCSPSTSSCIPGCARDENCAAPTATCDAIASTCVGCIDGDDCTDAALPICDADTQTCVACAPEGFGGGCVGTSPVCESAACRACAGASDCPSLLCNVDGSCVAASSVSYVTPSPGGGADCSLAAPCSIADAVAALGTRSTIYFLPGSYSNAAMVIASSATLVGDPATPPQLAGTAGLPVLSVAAASDAPLIVSAHHLNLAATGSTAAVLCSTTSTITRPQLGLETVDVSGGNRGIDANFCALSLQSSSVLGSSGIGIRVDGDSVLSIAASVVSGHTGLGVSANLSTVTISSTLIRSNAGGGATLSGGTFNLTNNFIVRNGNGTGTNVGGLSLSPSSPGNLLVFNTIAYNANYASGGGAGGVYCPSNLVGIVRANIIYGNTRASIPSQIADCGQTSPHLTMDAEINNVVRFLDIDNNNFHIGFDSPARDAASGITPPATDFDGDTRPSGTAADLGADEYVP
jgi:hypothetical protein